jgi:minor extracellular protease Epr
MNNVLEEHVERVGSAQEIADHLDWGLIDFLIPRLWESFGNKGEGTTVAVLDSGIDSHKDLDDNINYELAFDAINNSDIKDATGHGTGVAGVVAANDCGFGIVGVAPRSKVIPIKILGNNNSVPSMSCIERAFEYVLKIKPDVVNMSFGGRSPLSPLCEKYLHEMREKNIVVVCAAGNHGENFDCYPAKYSNTISVTSYNKNRNISNFSSRSSSADFALPGESILTTHLGNKYATVNGTSYSSPFLAGILSIIISKLKKNNKSFNLEYITDVLVKASIDYGPEGKDPMYGYGIICTEKLISEIKCN